MFFEAAVQVATDSVQHFCRKLKMEPLLVVKEQKVHLVAASVLHLPHKLLQIIFDFLVQVESNEFVLNLMIWIKRQKIMYCFYIGKK